MPPEAQGIAPWHTCAGVLSADDPTITVPMPIGGRVRDVDRCIAQLVAALNAGNVRTIASCCGHGRSPGTIALEDGRWLVITDRDTALAMSATEENETRRG